MKVLPTLEQQKRSSNLQNPHGHIFRGKDRKVKPVFPEDLQKMRNEFAIEEKNMFYLRHPYLSVEQSHGHSKSLGLREKRFREILNEDRLRFKDDVTIESRLGHLRYKECWD